MTNFFFERYRPEICRGLHKWCCEQILRHLRLFRAKKNFSKNLKFFDFFWISGVTDSWKMTNVFFERYRPEIYRGLHKWCCERILRRFGPFRAKKNFFEGSQFFDFFCISGVTDFLKMTNFFFERYRPEICRGLHKWCCEQILRHLRLFPATNYFFAKTGLKIFFKNWKFFDFFCISGVTDFLKNN